MTFIRKADRGEAGGRDPEHGKIVMLGMRKDCCIEAAAVSKRDADRLGIVDHMITGRDQPEIRIHDDAGAGDLRILRQRRVRKSRARVDGEPAGGSPVACHRDHRRRDAPDQRSQARRRGSQT